MRGFRACGPCGKVCLESPGWGWVPYVAGGVAPDSFICWVGYLSGRKTSQRDPCLTIPTSCKLPIGPAVGSLETCVCEPWKARLPTVCSILMAKSSPPAGDA